MTIDEMKQKLENTLSTKRFVHSLNVMDTAKELASKYGEDEEKAAIAGLLHDCAREIKGDKIFELCSTFGIPVDYITQHQPDLLHGPIGSFLARQDYGIGDVGILRAIYSHTTGRENMELLEKIVFMADYIEPNRNFPGVDEARMDVGTDINKALVIALNRTIKHVMIKGALIHPDTISARNYLIKEYGKVPMNELK